MKFAKYLAPVLALAALAACDEGTGSDTGRLTIRLHDAPGDLAEAVVQIERIYLTAGDEDGGHVVLNAPTGFINLLDLTNGRFTEIVQDLAVPTGRYGQLRVVIGDAYIRTSDGKYYAKQGTTIPGGITPDGTFRCPSCSTSGFKLNFPGGLQIGDGETILALDFDVGQSFGHQAGNSGQWIMRPVLRITEVTLGRSITGSVSLADAVTLPDSCGGTEVSLTQFVPTATSAAGMHTAVTVASTTTPTTYSFAFTALPITTYTMGHEAEITFTDSDETLTFEATASPASVDLAGGSTTVNYTVTGATCS